MERKIEEENKLSAAIEQERCNTVTMAEFVSAEILDLTEAILLPLRNFRVLTSF
jgi:hypothetical protein